MSRGLLKRALRTCAAGALAGLLAAGGWTPRSVFASEAYDSAKEASGNIATGVEVVHDLQCGKYNAAFTALAVKLLTLMIDGADPYVTAVQVLDATGVDLGGVAFNTLISGPGYQNYVNVRNAVRVNFLTTDPAGLHDLWEAWQTTAAPTNLPDDLKLDLKYNDEASFDTQLPKLMRNGSWQPVLSDDVNQTPTALTDWWTQFADQLTEPDSFASLPGAGGNTGSEFAYNALVIAVWEEAAPAKPTLNGESVTPQAWALAQAKANPKGPTAAQWHQGLLRMEAAYETQMSTGHAGLASSQYRRDEFTDWLKSLIGGYVPFGDYAVSIGEAAGGCDDPQSPEANSADPNAIAVSPPGSGPSGWIAAGQALTYVVRFTNEANATAAVQNVRVVLLLDGSLDPATIQPGASSFAGTEFAFDPVTSTVTWTLPGIDLPADTNPPNGEGWVSFTATPKAGLATGTAIRESAQVFFDYNPPITTTAVTSTVDAAAPTVTMGPAPAPQSAGTVTLTWSGNAAAGIDHYDVYESIDGGSLQYVASVTTPSVALTTLAGETVGVAVQATDVAGLSSPPPTAPQVRFQVPPAPARTAVGNSAPPVSGPTTGVSVGGAGGILVSADGLFHLAVPADGLVGGSILRVDESRRLSIGAAPLPTGLIAASPFFTLTGAQLASPAPAVVRASASVLGGLAPQRLALYLLGGEGWTALPTAVDPAADTITANIRSPAILVAVAATAHFSDLPPTNWAAPYVDTLLAAGAVAGYPDGTFRPAQAMTRAEFVKALVATMGLPTTPARTDLSGPFSDVPAGAWYAPYVAAAVRAGIAHGTSATTFSPGATLLREQAAVLLARALGLTAKAPLTFGDARAVDPWAVAGVREAVSAGLVAGFPNGTFDPHGPLTRAQAAKLLALAWRYRAP